MNMFDSSYSAATFLFLRIKKKFKKVCFIDVNEVRNKITEIALKVNQMEEFKNCLDSSIKRNKFVNSFELIISNYYKWVYQYTDLTHKGRIEELINLLIYLI